MNLQGLFVALVTPFDAEGQLDTAALQHLARHLAPHVEGFLVNGTTGDFPLLSREERREAIAAVVEAVGGEKLVLAGTGSASTRETLALTADAQAVGADAAVVITPYYLPTPAEGLYRHFATLAEAAPDLPLILYNFPQLAGQPIPPEIVARLRRDYPNIVGMKDTSGDLGYSDAVLAATDADFRLLIGRGTVVVPGMALGAAGTILADANIAAPAWHRVMEAVARGDWQTARSEQHRLAKLARLIGRGGSPLLRAVLARQGIDVGRPRLPLLPTEEEGWVEAALLLAEG